MADVFTKTRRPEVVSRIRGRESESPEIEFIPRDAEVFDNICDDATRHIAGMPREGDEAIRAEWISLRIIPLRFSVRVVGVVRGSPGG